MHPGGGEGQEKFEGVSRVVCEGVSPERPHAPLAWHMGHAPLVIPRAQAWKCSASSMSDSTAGGSEIFAWSEVRLGNFAVRHSGDIFFCVQYL